MNTQKQNKIGFWVVVTVITVMFFTAVWYIVMNGH